MTAGTTVGAARPKSHELLSATPPISTLKENLSVAFLSALAAASGLTPGRWDNDVNGVDVTLQSSFDYAPAALHPELAVQLKCTAQLIRQHKSTVSWQLDERTHAILSAKNRGTMAALCVMVTPDHPGHWTEFPPQGLLTYCHAYYIRGQDLPALPAGQKTVTVHIPRVNQLTPVSLLELMADAADWQA